MRRERVRNLAERVVAHFNPNGNELLPDRLNVLRVGMQASFVMVTRSEPASPPAAPLRTITIGHIHVRRPRRRPQPGVQKNARSDRLRLVQDEGSVPCSPLTQECHEPVPRMHTVDSVDHAVDRERPVECCIGLWAVKIALLQQSFQIPERTIAQLTRRDRKQLSSHVPPIRSACYRSR